MTSPLIEEHRHHKVNEEEKITACFNCSFIGAAITPREYKGNYARGFKYKGLVEFGPVTVLKFFCGDDCLQEIRAKGWKVMLS